MRLSSKAARKTETKAQRRQKHRIGSQPANDTQMTPSSNPFDALDKAAEEEADGMLTFYDYLN